MMCKDQWIGAHEQVAEDWLDDIDGGMSHSEACEKAYEALRDLGFDKDEALDEIETY